MPHEKLVELQERIEVLEGLLVAILSENHHMLVGGKKFAQHAVDLLTACHDQCSAMVGPDERCQGERLPLSNVCAEHAPPVAEAPADAR